MRRFNWHVICLCTLLLASNIFTAVAVADDQTDNYGCFKAGEKNGSVCFVAGAIAIPFRYVLSGNKDVLGGISGDLFAGMNVSVPGFPNGITFLSYLGYLPSFNSTTASNPGTSSNSQSGSSSSNNSTGGALDSGLGIALPVKMGNTHSHVGIVAGTDHTGKSNNYAYNGKWYASVLIGFTF